MFSLLLNSSTIPFCLPLILRCTRNDASFSSSTYTLSLFTSILALFYLLSFRCERKKQARVHVHTCVCFYVAASTMGVEGRGEPALSKNGIRAQGITVHLVGLFDRVALP